MLEEEQAREYVQSLDLQKCLSSNVIHLQLCSPSTCTPWHTLWNSIYALSLYTVLFSCKYQDCLTSVAGSSQDRVPIWQQVVGELYKLLLTLTFCRWVNCVEMIEKSSERKLEHKSVKRLAKGNLVLVTKTFTFCVMQICHLSYFILFVIIKIILIIAGR